MFVCYENGVECVSANFDSMKHMGPEFGWTNARFQTRAEAVAYMQNWLGIYAPSIEYWNNSDRLEIYDAHFQIMEEP